MKYSAATVLAAATAVMAGAYGHNNVTYTTEVVEVYTTYCPEPTTLTHGDKTYTITSATTLTITDCPCTISKPVLTTSVVECHNCAPPPKPTYTAPGVPHVPAPVPGHNQTTTKVVVPAPTTQAPETVPTAGAGKVAALSGAGLAGVLGLAAFVL
ncbi:Clock-controlled protein 6 like [Verticillium longisporum]|uniref:Clock-controlled protein 6 n=3 Tax=Verticillium TaxID=1036719 RepID=G2XER8_VERDV|nr:uncharacterized protein VDAG_08653 [Verticillium dahliae VdLs.17]KAF3345234.1 Bromodomain testis-specific protein [Verticillium dahliae VDG2]KAG7129446.1 Clock-controlled protein 6 like [Verticillium longisporum]KAH6709716.1 hypothetical protein EV126DRAFT_330284 [Verticillium dahliae]EGY18319.1 hypothetical protein VDAG_08653 [Verticillium dahliae VdLs.17]PNH27380.1 hypothetical protein BJF96_g9281 [Verticillium dahliae]